VNVTVSLQLLPAGTLEQLPVVAKSPVVAMLERTRLAVPSTILVILLGCGLLGHVSVQTREPYIGCKQTAPKRLDPRRISALRKRNMQPRLHFLDRCELLLHLGEHDFHLIGCLHLLRPLARAGLYS